METIEENCGFGVTHTLHDAYSSSKSLQHRGREASAIAGVGYERIDVLKWEGPVTKFDIVDLHKILPSHRYHTYLFHVRYATKGRKDKILEDAHPHTIGGKVLNRGSHIFIENCDAAIVHNGQVNPEYLSSIDSSKLKTGCDSEALLHFIIENSEYGTLKQIPGAYSLAFADKRRRDIVVLRDRHGIKPGVLGFKDGKYAVASEDIAFIENGGESIEDLDLGSAYYLSPNGSYKKQEIISPDPRYCFFEWNYITHRDSIINERSVEVVRKVLGEYLAKEFNPSDADFVFYAPRCAEVAARSYSKFTKKQFIPLLYKMRSDRSFQGSTLEERANSIEENLHLLPGLENTTKGKTAIIIDDSTIRGNVLKRVKALADEAGLKKLYVANYTPQIGIIGKDGIGRGCVYGVDMPPDDKFISRNKSPEQISKETGLEIYFISPEGMFQAFEKIGVPRKNLCSYCIGGEKPF
ncbi:MAG: hypothetical protein ACP5OG_02830 [Candidatus Nanoarchaeia archaeon]